MKFIETANSYSVLMKITKVVTILKGPLTSKVRGSQIQILFSQLSSPHCLETWILLILPQKLPRNYSPRHAPEPITPSCSAHSAYSPVILLEKLLQNIVTFFFSISASCSTYSCIKNRDIVLFNSISLVNLSFC